MSKRAKAGSVGSIPRTTRGITVGTLLHCADNSGAKVLKVISVASTRTRLNRLPSASVGHVVICSVKKGKENLLGKVVRAVVVRQRQVINRKGGYKLRFEDNAAVLISDKKEVKGTSISGPVAKECIEKFTKIGSIAQYVV